MLVLNQLIKALSCGGKYKKGGLTPEPLLGVVGHRGIKIAYSGPMKHFLLRLCLVCLSLQLPAQWEWVKVFPKTHRGLDAKVDSKGNFYIITNYNIYQQGPYVIYKLDKNANQIGEIVLPKNVNCKGFDVRSDDKLFVGGYFRDTVQFNQTTLLSRGKEDAILIGLNSDLQIFDVRTFGGKFDDRITGIAVVAVRLSVCEIPAKPI